MNVIRKTAKIASTKNAFKDVSWQQRGLLMGSRSMRPGPEQPTFVEKTVGAIGLPYPISCVIIGCILGAPGYFLLYLADSLDPGQALKQLTSSAFFAISQFGQPLPLEEGLAVAALYTAFLIMTLYFVRYMRVISLDVESGIVRLHPGYTEEEYHRTFGGISNIKLVLLMAAAFSLIYAPVRVKSSTGVFSLFSDVVLLPLDFVVVGAALWIYLRSLWGVYRFGSGPLKLVPYHRDRMLGLHPIGTMSLSFAIVYLVLDSLALVAGAMTGDIENLLVLVGLLVLLATMLFLPVYGIHQKMRVEKNRERAELHARIAKIVSAAEARQTENEREDMSDLKYLLAYRTLSGEVAKMQTWPFETGRLERFLAIFLSVTTIIIARLIQIAFHF